MKRASYRHAVYWIAENDEPLVLDEDEIASLVSTLLVADIFGVDPKRVGSDVAKKRRSSK